MLSVLKSMGRCSSFPPCHQRVSINNIRQSSVSHRIQSRSKSFCTGSDLSREIKSLERQRLFWFGLALAAPVATYLYFTNVVLRSHTAGAKMASSWHPKLAATFQNDMYGAISSKPEIMAVIGSDWRVDRPFSCQWSQKLAIIRASLSKKGRFVGEVVVEMPLDAADLAHNRTATSRGMSPLPRNQDSTVDCDIEVFVIGGDAFKFRASVARGARIEEVEHEFELDFEQVEEAALINDDDKAPER